MTAPKRGTLKNGAEPHILTTEERQRGAARTNAIKAEAAKSFRQKLAEKLDERADELADTLLAAGKEDWRALVAGLDQAFGKPTERHELSGADGGAISIEDRSASLVDVAKVLRDAGALPDHSG